MQSYLDEMVWRIEGRTIDEKRKYLISLLSVTSWNDFLTRLEGKEKSPYEKEKQAQQLIDPSDTTTGEEG